VSHRLHEHRRLCRSCVDIRIAAEAEVVEAARRRVLVRRAISWRESGFPSAASSLSGSVSHARSNGLALALARVANLREHRHPPRGHQLSRADRRGLLSAGAAAINASSTSAHNRRVRGLQCLALARREGDAAPL
jgi:hypothetical protein